jgi:zinc/manganese transport system permease protein
MILLAFAFAFVAAYAGLLCSFWFDLPAGPAIILTAGAIHVVSLVAGPRDGVLRRRLSRRHVMA